jgi:type VI secretion system secreted protein VgrG
MIFVLEVDGISARLLVQTVRGTEHMDAPAAFEVRCVPDVPHAERDALATDMLTRPATLAWDFGAAGQRTFSGLVDRLDVADDVWTVHLVARVAILGDAVGHRVFVEKGPITIARGIFEAHGLTVEVRATRTPAARPQCVQAFETDLGFASRLLAEEGYAWFSDPVERDKVVLADSPSSFENASGDAMPVRETGGFGTGTFLRDARVERRALTDKVSLRDWNFEKPAADLSVDAKEGAGKLEVYEFRGRYTDTGLGKTVAQIRLEEARARAIVLHGRTNHAGLAPGLVVSIQDAPGFEGVSEWLLLAVEHDGREGRADASERPYEARVEAVPREAPHRPARLPAATLGGLQTLDVTGAPGSEIHPDKYGRIRAHFRWDRVLPSDDTSSFWIRTLQPPTSGGVFLPRVGWEVLTSFYHGSADEPLELGRLYRGTDPPPVSLPGHKVHSTFGTRTSPGGGSTSGIVFDDTAGNEGMTWTAARDWKERTEKDKVFNVTANDKLDVGAKRTLIVGQVHEVKVAGAQAYTVSANRTVNVTANKSIKAASETVLVGAARIFDIGGDQQTQCASLARLVGAAKIETAIESHSSLVTGASTVLIGATLGQKHGLSHSISVGGLNKEEVGGVKSIKGKGFGLEVKGAYIESFASRKITAAGDIKEEYTASASYDVAGAASLKGSDVVVKATDKIVIKAGGATITITSSSIEVDGDLKSSKKSKDKNDESYG